MQKLKNNFGFTLVEMLIVMLIISVLLLLIIPNVTGQRESVNDKGCAALVAVVQAQADAYYLDNKSVVDGIQTLVSDNYLEEEQTTCEGEKITISDGQAVNPLKSK